MATLIVLGIVVVVFIAFAAYMMKLSATTDDLFFPIVFACSAFLAAGILLNHIVN